MPLITLPTIIRAPIERCVDLARDLDLRFGVRLRLTSRIAAFERPHRLTDKLVRGPFARFIHRHEFAPVPSGTLISDRFDCNLTAAAVR